MPNNPSKIICSQCAKPGVSENIKCPHCGGRVVRVCGACGFKNSGAKKYCDVCGEGMTAAAAGDPAPVPQQPAKPPLPEKRLTPPPVRRDDEAPVRPRKEDSGKSHREELQKAIPRTFIQRLAGTPPAAPPEQKPPPREPRPPEKIPEAQPKVRFTPTEFQRDHARHKQREKDREQERRQHDPSRKAHARRIEPTLRRIQERPVFSTLLGLVLLLIGAGLYGFFWKTKRTPSKMLTQTVGKYLFALKQKNYSEAYAMLSADSRQAGSLGEFAALQDAAVWTFDDIRLESLSGDWAFLRYKLLVSAQPVEDDWLHFKLEDGEWRRVYWWHLQPRIEAALENKDFPAALNLTQAAAKINPRDPMTSAYLCEAAYHTESYPTAEAACRRAFKAAETYPSRLSAKGIFHLHALLADTYRSRLNRPPDALEQYKILLAFPSISPAEACDLTLARADTLLSLREYTQAVEDFRAAERLCRRKADADYANRGNRILTGMAGEDAIQALKNHHMAGDKKTVAEWRSSAREDLAQRLKTGRGSVPDEKWAASYISGSTYKVSLRDEVNEILSAAVDLWTHDIKVDIHVQ